jgi:hypothetical protein
VQDAIAIGTELLEMKSAQKTEREREEGHGGTRREGDEQIGR